jgi:formylglycine-generating enzyme required for sulfatase activity
MMRETTCRSALTTICLLLVCAVLSSAQSRSRGQKEPQGVTGIPSTPSASPSERRVALVIGNAAYRHTAPLKNPVNDAQDIARVLKDLQFQVQLKTDATLETMADAIFTFGEQLKGGGVGLFYYAGHGMQVKGENYLLPIDANIGREDEVKRKTINAREVLDKMDEAKSHLNLVFLDACRNNPFPRNVRAVSRGLADMIAASGTLLVFATTPDNVAEDGSGRNGTYTKHLLRYITQPGLEVGMLLRRVRTAVKDETGGRQVPWENGSIEGEFYFAGTGGVSSVTPLAASPPPPSPATGTQVAVGSYPQQPQTPPATIVGNDGAEMMLVPAGEFNMGSDKDEIDRLLQGGTNVNREFFDHEIPRHRVYLDGFYIDKHEVTNARFQQFVQATGHRTQAERDGSGYVYTGQTWEQVNGANWHAPRGPGSSIANLEQHPVVQVSREDARAYCAWAGKRLPTEAEWEKAARGTEGQIYPWGNQFDGKRANFCDTNCEFTWKDSTANDGYRYTAPVGSYEGGKSLYGAYDMAGNVWEWVADWYDKNYYRNSPIRNPQGPASGEQAVLRGGGWTDGALNVRAPDRGRFTPAIRIAFIGFRCAKTL